MYQVFNNQTEEKVYSRAKIGHTYTTHADLFKDEDISQCISCACPMSVKHILLECVEFDNILEHYFSVTDLKALFRKKNAIIRDGWFFSYYWTLYQILILIQVLGL